MYGIGVAWKENLGLSVKGKEVLFICLLVLTLDQQFSTTIPDSLEVNPYLTLTVSPYSVCSYLEVTLEFISEQICLG